MSKILLFNKPFNVLSQFTDQQARATLADYIDNNDVYPAGRLDYDSEGLLILTDDGKLQHQISHPDHKQLKTYWVQVEGEISDKDLEPLRKGIELKDGPCRPARVSLIPPPDIWSRQPPIRVRKAIPTRWLKISLGEGRNRQVRRMTAAIGYPTLRLIRVQIGPWQLGDLQPGQYKVSTIHSPAQKPVKRKRASARQRRL
jgi:23S rRNA pseudouridine2457 synthase